MELELTLSRLGAQFSDIHDLVSLTKNVFIRRLQARNSGVVGIWFEFNELLLHAVLIIDFLLSAVKF